MVNESQEAQETAENPESNNDSGVQSESSKLLERANQTAQRLEQANRTAEELIKRGEELKAQDILGGRTEAGEQPQRPKEETPKEYADRVMRNEA